MPNPVVLVPAATVLALAMICVLPWGTPAALQFAWPGLPLTAIHFWARVRPSTMPAALVFAIGLLVDVLTFGPLGYWSMLYFAGLGSAHMTGHLDSEPGGRARSVGLAEFACITAFVALVGWMLASVYFARFVDWRPMALAVLVLPLLFPGILVLLTPCERWVVGPQVLNLDRRG